MDIQNGTVVAVVDGEQFALYRNSGNGPQPELTIFKSPDIDNHNKSAGVHRPNTSATGEGSRSLEEAGHAAGVVDWLNQQVLQHKIDSLIVIADPKSLGEMRRHYHKELEAALIGEIAKTLTNQPADAVEKAISGA